MADLLIIVGEYVLVQEGQVDQPKLAVWDDLTITEAVAVSVAGNFLSIEAFDLVTVTETAPDVRMDMQYHGHRMFQWEVS